MYVDYKEVGKLIAKRRKELGADIEALCHSISDIQSEVLWRFY